MAMSSLKDTRPLAETLEDQLGGRWDLTVRKYLYRLDNPDEKFADLQAHMEPNMQVANDAPLLPDLNASKRRTEDKFADLQAHMEPNMQVTDDAPLLPDLNDSKRRTEEKFVDLRAHMEPNMQVANDAPFLPDLNVSKRRTERNMRTIATHRTVAVEQRRCSVCQKVFDSVKYMSGHINCHPVRGCKIVYPPPTFNMKDKFADLQAHMEPNMQVTDDAPLLPDLNVSKRRTEEKFADLQAHMEPNMQVANDAPLLPDLNVSKRRTEEKFADLQAHMEPNMQVANDAPLLPDLNASKRRTEEKFADLQAHMEPNMQVANDAPLLPDLNVSKRRTERNMRTIATHRTVAVEQRRCSVCQKVFDSVKYMYGHINCHPVRGCKIVYPPPTFNMKEKFA
ncbi:hypothetical protein RND71_002041 [Anisodus tanguticus]|uniref:C2H2-type domain-containing protein n=1 Tax=Anisodus tanguticus TaxID=243964 RepID=A0AAE1T227_9SOLA|nr:hypothetical protein RND71_002041 [Anisodus tanguticus]